MSEAIDLVKVDLMTEVDSCRRGWQACEARVEKFQKQADDLAAQNLTLCKLAEELAKARAERDELAATVERLREALEELRTEYEGDRTADSARATTYKWSLTRIHYALSATPAQNLAKVRADHFRQAAEHLTMFRVCREQYGHAKAAVTLDVEALNREADRIEAEAAR